MNRVELQVGCHFQITPVVVRRGLSLRRATVEAANKLAFPGGRHSSRLCMGAREGKRENGLSCSDHMNDVDHMITVSGSLREQCLSGLCAAQRTIATRTLP
jgi:hypothetical protein